MTRQKQKFSLPPFPKVVQFCGLGIAIYETLVEKVDRPSLLVLAAGMMGLDSILKAQNARNGNGNGDGKE